MILFKKATREGGKERKVIMTETIIAMNDLMNNYRTFKEETKKNFFWDDMSNVIFNVETGLSLIEEDSYSFKSLYGAFKFVQKVMIEATNVSSQKYESWRDDFDGYYENYRKNYWRLCDEDFFDIDVEQLPDYFDERDEIFCQIHIFYNEGDYEYSDKLFEFEKIDEKNVLCTFEEI